jgi:hypothetical protein
VVALETRRMQTFCQSSAVWRNVHRVCARHSPIYGSSCRCICVRRAGGVLTYMRGTGVRQTPNRPRPEVLVLRLEVRSCRVRARCWGVSSLASTNASEIATLAVVRQFASLLGFSLLSRGLKVSLHPVDTYRNAVDEPERLRVFGKHRCEQAGDNVSKSSKEKCPRWQASARAVTIPESPCPDRRCHWSDQINSFPQTVRSALC